MAGGRLGVSPRLGGPAPVWSVTRGGLKVTFGAGAEVPAEPVVSLRMADGSEVRRLLRDVRARQVAAAVPWRAARSARGQSHYPGFYWSETTGSHVVYESRLELARLLVADFDPVVTAIAAQPFLLRAHAGGRVRRHVPDFFLVRADESALLVNVKPAARLADPAVAGALEWPGRLAREHGWDYEVWSGADPVFLANVRFLAGYRRPWLLPGGLADAVLAAFRSGDTLAALAGRTGLGCPAGTVRAAVLRLLWERRLVTDLHRCLDGDSVLEAADG
jgi:hypothetical protein